MSYTDRDFQALQDLVKEKIKDKFPDLWQDFYKHNAGNIVINAFVWLIDNLNIYMDRQAMETYLMTAQEPRNLWNIAMSLGYQPKINSPAVGELILKGQDITLAEGTELDIGGYKVILREELEVVNGEGKAVVSQEERIALSFTSSGTGREEFDLGEGVSEVESVVVEGKSLAKTESLLMEKGYRFYKRWDLHGVIEVKDVPAGKQINVTARKTGGDIGEINSAGTLSINSISYEYRLSLSGGVDFEDSKNLKDGARQAFISQHRLVSVEDYEKFVASFPGVSRVKVMDAYTDSGVKYLTVKVLIDNGDADLIKEEIKRRKVVDTLVEVVKATPVAIDISLKTYGGDRNRVRELAAEYVNSLQIGQGADEGMLVSYIVSRYPVAVMVENLQSVSVGREDYLVPGNIIVA